MLRSDEVEELVLEVELIAAQLAGFVSRYWRARAVLVFFGTLSLARTLW